MFYKWEKLISLDLDSWDTSNVENMRWMLNKCNSLLKLILGSKTILTSALLPNVPAIGTKIPGTDRVVTAPYWVATSGYQQGQRYTSRELEQLTGRDR